MYRICMKEIEDLTKKRDTLCSWMENSNIVKMSILLILIQIITVKIPSSIFIVINFIWKSEETRIAKQFLGQFGKLILLDFKTF